MTRTQDSSRGDFSQLSQADPPAFYASAAVFLVVLAVCYNTGLAVINAHITPMTNAVVVASEMLIAFCGTVLVALAFPRLNRMWPAFFLIGVALVTTPLVTVFQGEIYLKGFRDFYMIALFFLLGGLIDEQKLRRLFLFFGIAIGVVMIVEGWMTASYVALFEPADYFANTRGIDSLEIDESGLFRNSLGFEGRFSYGIFDTHRLSSIFLEQVSLANFSMVLAIFLSCFWKKIGRFERYFFASLIVFIILTNDSRTASAMCALIFIGHFIIPFLPRYLNALLMPAIILIAAVLFYDPLTYFFEDSLKGRIGHSIHMLTSLDAKELLMGNFSKIIRTGDSGYLYIIYSQGLLGLISFWLFTAFCIPQNTAEAKRFSYNASLVIFFNLLIGAAIFSVKISAPLWFIAGYLYSLGLRSPLEEDRS